MYIGCFYLFILCVPSLSKLSAYLLTPADHGQRGLNPRRTNGLLKGYPVPRKSVYAPSRRGWLRDTPLEFLAKSRCGRLGRRFVVWIGAMGPINVVITIGRFKGVISGRGYYHTRVVSKTCERALVDGRFSGRFGQEVNFWEKVLRSGKYWVESGKEAAEVWESVYCGLLVALVVLLYYLESIPKGPKE